MPCTLRTLRMRADYCTAFARQDEQPTLPGRSHPTWLAARPERRHDYTVWHLADAPPALVVVAHGGTNAVLCAHLLDIRPVPWEWIRFESSLASYSVVRARSLGDEGRVWSLQNFNELNHLRAAGLL